MLRELDCVVLTKDIANAALTRGDVGTIVHLYPGGEAFEVEFVRADGGTVAVLTLTTDDVTPLGDAIPSARTFGKTTVPHISLAEAIHSQRS